MPIFYKKDQIIHVSATAAEAPAVIRYDTNLDGVIDIIDDANIYAGWDTNDDGVIDILDWSNIYAGDAFIVDNPPDSDFEPNPELDDIINNPLIIPPITEITFCEESSSTQTKSRVRFSGVGFSPGIITTGCNSIPNIDGTIIWPDWFENPDAVSDPFFCPPGKARGFVYNAQTGTVGYTNECTCYDKDSLVSATELAMVFIGPIRDGAKGAAKQALGKTIHAAEESLENALKYKKLLEGLLTSIRETIQNLRDANDKLVKRISRLSDALKTGIDPVTGKKMSPDQMSQIPGRIEQLVKQLDGVVKDLMKKDSEKERIKAEIARFEGIISYFKGIAEKAKPVLDNLDHFDPANWVVLFMGALVPISQFLVPKECGYPLVLNDQCECVTDEGSGSGSGSGG